MQTISKTQLLSEYLIMYAGNCNCPWWTTRFFWQNIQY